MGYYKWFSFGNEGGDCLAGWLASKSSMNLYIPWKLQVVGFGSRIGIPDKETSRHVIHSFQGKRTNIHPIVLDQSLVIHSSFVIDLVRFDSIHRRQHRCRDRLRYPSVATTLLPRMIRFDWFVRVGISTTRDRPIASFAIRRTTQAGSKPEAFLFRETICWSSSVLLLLLLLLALWCRLCMEIQYNTIQCRGAGVRGFVWCGLWDGALMHAVQRGASIRFTSPTISESRICDGIAIQMQMTVMRSFIPPFVSASCCIGLDWILLYCIERGQFANRAIRKRLESVVLQRERDAMSQQASHGITWHGMAWCDTTSCACMHISMHAY